MHPAGISCGHEHRSAVISSKINSRLEIASSLRSSQWRNRQHPSIMNRRIISCRIQHSPASTTSPITCSICLMQSSACQVHPQGSYEIPSWTENFAWYELCGGVTAFNQNDFQQLTDQEISAALSKLRIVIDWFLSLVSWLETWNFRLTSFFLILTFAFKHK